MSVITTNIMHATTREINLFTKHTLDLKSYLEFGCGGSTFNILYLTEANAISVESDFNFARQLLNNLMIFGNRLNIFHVNIGAAKEWGVPVDDSSKASFSSYSSAIFNAINRGWGEIDTIFVDGRFRVACALKSIKHYPNSKIIIHDFFDRLEIYGCLLEFLEYIDRVDTLGIFFVKDCKKEKLEKYYEEYKYDFR